MGGGCVCVGWGGGSQASGMAVQALVPASAPPHAIHLRAEVGEGRPKLLSEEPNKINLCQSLLLLVANHQAPN